MAGRNYKHIYKRSRTSLLPKKSSNSGHSLLYNVKINCVQSTNCLKFHNQEITPVPQWYLLYLLRYWLLVQFPGAAKLSQKNCVNYQLDNLLIKEVVGSTIKTRQPKNVGDDGKSHLQSNGSLMGPLSPIQADRNYSIYPDPSGPVVVPVSKVGEAVHLPVFVGILGLKPTVLESPFV